MKEKINYNINVENKMYIILGCIFTILVLVVLVISVRDNSTQYLVQKEKIEYTEITKGFVIKKEATIDRKQDKILVPVVAEGAKISKNGIIATYKGEEYEDYEETLAKLDKEILERMQDLPITYSSEVDAIDEIIRELVKQSIGENSYSKMQQYKQKINSNINKRATLIGELSPEGAEIKKLIAKRNEYENEAKKSNDNVLSPMTGIVTYNTDGLEDDLLYDNINTLSYDTIKNIVNSEKQIDNNKIKIVNNYEAYVIVMAKQENLEYMEVGYDYRIKLIEQNNYELLGEIEKINNTENGVEVYFKITNGIENIINLRECEIEVVWNYEEGLFIPSKALNKYDNKEAYYVSVIKKSEYVNIPVKIKIKNDSYAIVDNFSDEELENLKLDCDYSLKLYDRLIVKSK